jgi:hypothetical protein
MSHYALDLPEALVQEAQAVAQAAQTSLDDCVRLAMADKIAAARTTQYVQTRAARADPQAFLAVLERIKRAAGPVVAGDKLSQDRWRPLPAWHGSRPKAGRAASGREHGDAGDKRRTPVE